MRQAFVTTLKQYPKPTTSQLLYLLHTISSSRDNLQNYLQSRDFYHQLFY